MESIETEQVLLGGLMRNNAVYDVIAPLVSTDDFASAAHATLFSACGALIDNSRSADPVTLGKDTLVLEALRGEGLDAGYLIRLFRESSIGKARDHATLIHDMALRRKLAEIGDGIKMDAERWPVDRPIGELFERIWAELDEVRGVDSTTFEARSLNAVLDEALEESLLASTGKGVLGARCGISDLDEMVGGFQGGKLYLFAGRTAMGKSILAANLLTGLPDILFFSCEMGATEVGKRVLSAHSEIRAEYQDADRGLWGKSKKYSLEMARDRLKAKSAFIDANPAPTLQDIDRGVRKRLRMGKLGAVMIDHILRMTPPEHTRGDVRVGINEIIRGLKTMAKRYNVPFIVFAQVSRKVENRPDKRAKLSDLKETSALEEESDVVGFLYRDGYYNPTNDAGDTLGPEQDIEIAIAKNRAGPTYKKKFFIDLGTSRIRNLAHG